MRTEIKFLIYVLTCAFAVIVGHAQSLTNLAGVWNGLSFDVPTQLVPQFSSGLVTNVIGHDAFGSSIFQVNAYSDGTFTNGEATGTMSIDGQGKMTVHLNGGSPIYFRVNFAQDVFAGITTSSNSDGTPQNELNLVVRAPAFLATNEVTGTWQIIFFDMPQQLIQSFLPTNGFDVVSDLTGLDNQSVTSSPLTQTGNGSMTIKPDGTLSGTAGDPFTGTYGLATNGQVNISIATGSGSFSMAGFINASKDTMVALHTEDTNNRQEIVVLTKPPTNAVLTDLQGAWKITSFNVPAGVLLTHDASNYVTAVDTSDTFSMSQHAYTAGNDGFVTGNLEGVANIGTTSVTTDGVVSIAFTNLFGHVETHTGQLNAGKNCITLVENDSVRPSITMVTKAPDYPAAGGADFGLLMFGTSIYWAAGTNRELQTVGNLGGTWAPLSATLGQHQYLTGFTNQAGFFRVGG